MPTHRPPKCDCRCGGECPCVVNDDFSVDTIGDYELTPETADFAISGGQLSSTLDGRATQSLDLPSGSNVIGVEATLTDNSHSSFGLWIGDGTRNVQWLWQPGSNDCRLIVADGVTLIDQTYAGDPASTLKVTLGGSEGDWTIKLYRDSTLVATHSAVAVTFDAYRVACGVTSTGGGTWDDLCLISCDAVCDPISCTQHGANHEDSGDLGATAPFHRRVHMGSLVERCIQDCAEFHVTVPAFTGPDGCSTFGGRTFRIWAKQNLNAPWGDYWSLCTIPCDPGTDNSVCMIPLRPLETGPFGTEWGGGHPYPDKVWINWTFEGASDPTRLGIAFTIFYQAMPDGVGGVNGCALRWSRLLTCNDPEWSCQQLLDGIALTDDPDVPWDTIGIDPAGDGLCCGFTEPAIFRVVPQDPCEEPPPAANGCCPDLLPDLSITYVTSGGATAGIIALLDDESNIWVWQVTINFNMGGSPCKFDVTLECVPSQPGVGSTRFKIHVGDDIYEIEDFGSCESFLIEQDHVTDDVCPSRPGTMTITITG